MDTNYQLLISGLQPEMPLNMYGMYVSSVIGLNFVCRAVLYCTVLFCTVLYQREIRMSSTLITSEPSIQLKGLSEEY